MVLFKSGDEYTNAEASIVDEIFQSMTRQDEDPHKEIVKRRDRQGNVTEEERGWVYSDDWLLLNTLADFYSDHNKAEDYEAITWMVENKKRPYKASDADGWLWFCLGRTVQGLEDAESDIPPEVYDLCGDFDSEEASQKRWPTFERAFRSFIEGFKRWRKDESAKVRGGRD